MIFYIESKGEKEFGNFGYLECAFRGHRILFDKYMVHGRRVRQGTSGTYVMCWTRVEFWMPRKFCSLDGLVANQTK